MCPVDCKKSMFILQSQERKTFSSKDCLFPSNWLSEFILFFHLFSKAMVCFFKESIFLDFTVNSASTDIFSWEAIYVRNERAVFFSG